MNVAFEKVDENMWREVLIRYQEKLMINIFVTVLNENWCHKYYSGLLYIKYSLRELLNS